MLSLTLSLNIESYVNHFIIPLFLVFFKSALILIVRPWFKIEIFNILVMYESEVSDFNIL